MKNRCFFCIACIFFHALTLSAFAQESSTTTEPSAETIMNQNALLARSSQDYMVTAGDVYTLAYAVGTTRVTYVIAVDTSYRIRVSNLGIVNGEGRTFPQIRREIEAIVTNNHPLSGVQLVLTQPAMFKVYVNGEVRIAGEQPAWALTRLSELLVDENITNNTSIRDISIKSANGQTKVCDLFKAQRLGDLTHDPYLRPGDIITFNKVQRVISIFGAVERPGNYQIVQGENLKELIEVFVGGFNPLADRSRIELVRLINSDDVSGNTIFLAESDIAANYQLEHFDALIVPSIFSLRPVMFVEGAVNATWQALDSGTEDTAVQDLSASTRLVVQFTSGETYASLVRRNANWFTAVSDTQNAYIIRRDERIPVNLNFALYDVSYRGTLLVENEDVLIVPFRQYFITVAGAVNNPGRYPYIPDRSWEYYIGLAGGFIAERNDRESIIITDINGKLLNKSDLITPETTITARSNHGLYYFNQVAPIVTAILSILSTVLTVIAITQ